MVRYKQTKKKTTESNTKEQSVAKRKQDESLSTRIPPTASNRRRLAIERQKNQRSKKKKKKKAKALETANSGTEQNSSESGDSGSAEEKSNEGEEGEQVDVNLDEQDDNVDGSDDGDEGDEGDDGEEEDDGDEGEEEDDADEGEDEGNGDEGEEGDDEDEGSGGDDGDKIDKQVTVVEDETLASTPQIKRRRMKQVSRDNSDSEDSEEYVPEEEVHELEKRRSIKKGQRPQKEPSPEPANIDVQPEILFAFRDHIARKIWSSTEPRGEARVVRVHNHVGTQRLWDYRKEFSFVQNVVAQSGLQQLEVYTHDKLDKVLINAFVEFFYPETNTFHLPFGELGITIDEVVHITGLPAEGRAVT